MNDDDIKPSKVLMWATIGIVVVFLAAVLIAYLAGAFSSLTAETRGQTGVREKTVADGNYRIAAYDKFYDDCAAVQAVEDQIKTVGDSDDPNRTTNVLALTNQRNILIRQYNVDARKAGTRGQFRASDLPFEIDPTQETTSC